MSTSQSAHGSGWLLVGLVLLGLGACRTSPPPPPEPAPAGSAPPAVAAIPAGARAYRIDPEESLLQIFVYRGGAMARLGHNHVIASRHLAGAVYVTDDPFGTRFDLAFPVSGLTVDEPALRAAAGPDFSATIPESAREGTRSNLLSAALLDAAHHPQIRLQATDVRAAGEAYDVGVDVTLKGITHRLRVPVKVERRDGAVAASGEFPLKQSELGLEPFSVAMGTLVVVDEMRVRFDVVARGS